jgi:hypothetical protein
MICVAYWMNIWTLQQIFSSLCAVVPVGQGTVTSPGSGGAFRNHVSG